jgi:predicted DNA-binding transcriptional regulator AlpA
MPTEIPIPATHHIDRRAGKLAAEIAAGGDPDELLSAKELAELADMSVQFFDIGRIRGYGPRFVRLSPRRIRYRRADFVEWLEARTYQRTSDYEHQISGFGRKPGTKIVGGNGPGGRGGHAVLPDEAA